MNDLERTRELAAQYQELQQAAAIAPELEKRAADEQRKAHAAQTAAQLETHAQQQLADFQAEKLANDAALVTWLSQGQAIIEERQRLVTRAEQVFRQFVQWSTAGFAAGVLSDPSGFIDQGAIKGKAEEAIKRLNGDSNLMTWPKVAPGSIASYLLNVVAEFLQRNIPR